VNLSQLQSEHGEWVKHNFPDQLPHQPLLGLAEEVGELSHAHLKHEQGIRGYSTTEYFAEAEDAVGDIMVYLASYCNANHIDLEGATERTWARVKKRDWIADPVKGGEGAAAR
jgi:NTP pyrophosphatase (non-canonical NTP hydrolase)